MRSLKRNIEIVVITTFLLFVFLISKSMQVTAAEILPAHENNIEIEEIKSTEIIDVKNKPLKEPSALSEETTVIEDVEEARKPETTISAEDQEDSADVMPEESKDQAHPEETQVSETTESSVDFSTDEVEENQSQTLAATPAPEYEIQERDGNLYIVNTATGEVRKDNAWVELNGLYYFPNAAGILYRDRAITFGPQTMYYLDHNGAKVMDDVVSYGNELYLLNEEGKSIQPKVGWLDKGDRHYFANEQGKFYRGQWISFGPKIRHYMGADGRAYLGVREVGKNLHLFDDETYTRGVLRRDNAWVTYQGKDYFPNAEGKLYYNQFISFGEDNLYYLDHSGAKVLDDVVSYGNELYLLNEEGKSIQPKVGWLDKGNRHYFANAQGKFYRGQWISFGPKIKHYMGADGAAYVGVREVGKNLHLFDDESYARGVLRRDNAWVTYQGKEYFPSAEGNLYHDQVISFGPDNLYYLDKDGSKLAREKIVNYNNRIYYFGENGRPKKAEVGWYDIDGKHYFASEQGEFYRNQWISFGPKIRHYMGADGAAYVGVREVGNNLHLFDDRNHQRGVLRKDNAWVTYQGKDYFPNAEGKLYHNQFISFGKDNLYYLQKDGTKQTGIFVTSQGRYYYADENGKVLSYKYVNATDKITLKKAIAWNFFMDCGYSDEAISAILGNIEAESAWCEDAIEKSNQEGIGLVQWSYSRKKAFLAYAKEQGKEWTDLETQLAYLLLEMETPSLQGWRFSKRTLPYPAPYHFYGLDNGIEDFKKLKDINLASNIFMLNFESPAFSETELYKRQQFAHQTFRRFSKNIVVYLDPGHGGEDSGAYVSNVKEANLNLPIALMIKDELSKAGYQVIMSRETDKTVDLLQRSEDANRKNAHIFISVHNNLMPGISSVNGTETYYYDGVPSNYVRINKDMHVNPVRLQQSKELATLVQNAIIRNIGSYNRGVRVENFSVIRESKMPAILIEGGYMSNANELRKLQTDTYQRKIAVAVASAVNSYFYRT